MSSRDGVVGVVSGLGELTLDELVTRAVIGPRKEAMEAGAELRRRFSSLERERDEAREALRPPRRPNEEGGPGKEDAYWLKQKLSAAVTHLRDIEDEFRLRGGTPDGFNQVRADRARSIYEQITEDFLNGKRNVPTMRERAESAERDRDRLREALREIRRYFAAEFREGEKAYQAVIIARAALSEGDEQRAVDLDLCREEGEGVDDGE